MALKKLALFFVLPALLLTHLVGGEVSCAFDFQSGKEAPQSKWSLTQPPVNLEHIFRGEINRRGKPVGYHSRPGGADPENARVTRITAGPNRLGVYEATVEIRTKEGRWLRKRSTFFPDQLEETQVIEAILHAYHNHTSLQSNRFSGPSGKGFIIQGYLLEDGRINTAFPLYTRDP